MLEKLDKKRDAKQTVLQAQQILKSIPSEKDDRFPESLRIAANNGTSISIG